MVEALPSSPHDAVSVGWIMGAGEVAAEAGAFVEIMG